MTTPFPSPTGHRLGLNRLGGTFLAAFLLVIPGCGDEVPEQGPASEPTPSSPAPAQVSIPSELIGRIAVPFNRGVAYMDQFHAGKAVTAFEEVVKLAPAWILGHLNLGIALLNAQTDTSLSRAEQELSWVAERDPTNPYAHYSLGMLFRHQGRFEEAKKQFEAVLGIDPDDADTHYQLGVLLFDEDPTSARRHLEATLAKVPHHAAAAYRLHTLLRNAGETDRAKQMLERYYTLQSSGVGVFSGMKYGEMGRYAEVVQAFGDPGPGLAPGILPTYTDIAGQTGLTLASRGTPGWPGRSPHKDATGFGPGVATASEGDDFYIYLTGVGPDGGGALYRYGSGIAAPVQESGIDGHGAIGAYFGDYDGDGDQDLYLTRAGPNRLYRNDGGRFSDVTGVTGTSGGAFISIGAAWADADHDGDLDLYVANYAPFSQGGAAAQGAPNMLWRNNGDGSFAEVAAGTGIDGGTASSMGVLFFDIDSDRDLDLYLINDGSPNRVFLNDRVGRYTDATDRFPGLADAGPGFGALLGDVDLNGAEDLLLLRGPEPPRLFLQGERGRFQEDHGFETTGIAGATGGLMGDLDLDGDLDLVLLDGLRNGAIRHRILLNTGTGRFETPVPFGPARDTPDARGAVAMDLDGDGGLELLVARIGATPELWHAPAPAGRHWLEVIPTASFDGNVSGTEPGADGLQVEVKAGRSLQVASITASAGYLGSYPRRLHFGLGDRPKADYVRLSWSDAVIQSEMEVAADQPWRIAKMQRKPSSCPVLFCWDGERFSFVTDFLGVGGVGFFVAPGVYAPPDPTEDVRIPPGLIVPRDGRYLLRVTEPLEEVTYLDQVHLVAYDHPEDWAIYPDERFTGTPPFPTGRPFAVRERIFPMAAQDDRGTDILERLRGIDRRYAEPPKDPRFVGYARDHWIELDFGDQLSRLDPDAQLVLYLYGWVEYTYSHVNYAAYQAGVTMRAPWIEVPDGHGGWRVAMQEAGFPAGLPRMMTLDISSLPRDGRLRIHSNMEVFWDQIFVGENVLGPELRVTKLEPAMAELHALGYPREFSPDGAEPTIYDYHRLDMGVPFKNMRGDFTRFGDVRPLLAGVDDRFVVMGRGEEIALEFDASGLPALPEGWSRTLVLHTDGYCKDMDLYTAYPDTVKPLPFHGMKNYPPNDRLPSISGRDEYPRRWNTRHFLDN